MVVPMSSLPPPSEEERKFLLFCCADLGEGFFERCRICGEHLYRVNETMNLTRIPPESFWSKHVCDSLSLLLALPDIAGKALAVCDMGCGAGFPSLILAAALDHWHITALDSTGKKIECVRRAAELMDLSHLEALHGRAREISRKSPWKGSCDLVTARAVSDAPALVRESSPFLKKGGVLAVYRTMRQAEEELPLLKTLKCRTDLTDEFELPGGAGRRMFLLIRF